MMRKRVVMIRTSITETKTNTMPPKLDDESPTERVQIVTTAAWMARVEEWRRKQARIPSKSEAIRLLVDQALADAAKRGK
jgi:hypothetical protein